MATVDKPVSSYEPRKEAIGQLLSLTNPSIVVPDWQRNYSWRAEQTDAFWFDLLKFDERGSDDNKGEYFLGSVVIVSTEDGKLKLLDGQQRLATSAILLSVIRDKTATYNADAAKQLQSNYLVGFDHVSQTVIHKIRLNVYDRDFFRQLILDERGGDYVEPVPAIASHHLIFNARKRFSAALEDLTKDLQEKQAFSRCMRLAHCLLRNMTVIAVYSSDEESAAEVFETLNGRGIGLSTPDLLRNLIIRRADQGAQDTVVELWKDVVSFETDTLIQNYLRHYWVSRYGDVKTQSLYREIKGVVLENDLDSVELSTTLSSSAEVYRSIIKADTSSEILNRLLREILDFGNSSRILFPVILGLVEELGPEDSIPYIEVLQNVFVRHSIILNLENSRLENRIYSGSVTLRIFVRIRRI